MLRDAWNAKTRSQRAALVLAVLLSLMALVQANHRAGQGRSALLKWQPAFEALDSDEAVYEVGSEGYPTLPFSLLVMRPFHVLSNALGERGGALGWALFKLVLAWWIVTSALRLAAGRCDEYPGLGQLVVLLLAFRVLLSDILHGNTNIVVGATVVAAALCWRRGRTLQSGLWIAVGAVLKVTPAFALLYFAWKRSLRAALGFVLGLALTAFALPGALLGWQRNLALVEAWWRQMIVPYATGRELGLTQTEHINQSLLGVLARWTTDSVAIPAQPPERPNDLYINVIELAPAGFHALHLVLAIVVVAVALWFVGSGRDRRGPHVLAEFSLLALAMLILSERSWKHHYVLLAWPLAFLVWQWTRGDSRRRTVAAAGVLLSAGLHGLSGSGVLGAHGSNLAEAWGVHLWGALALFVATGLCLRWSRRNEPRAGPGPSD